MHNDKTLKVEAMNSKFAKQDLRQRISALVPTPSTVVRVGLEPIA